VVNYESWDEIDRLLGDLAGDPELTAGRAEVVLVDNASTAAGPPAGFRPGERVSLLRRGRNDGFAAAVNDALAIARGRWVLLLNPDVVAGPNLASRVIARALELEERPGGGPGIVGFRLLNEDGTPQPSVGAFPSLAWCLREAIVPRHRRKYKSGTRRAGPAPWVTGACMLVRRDLLDQLGGLDADFFLYHEEVALCRRATELGWTVEFDPAVEVVHLRPLQNRAVPPPMRVITRHSKLLYFRKHLPRWQFEGLACIVRAEATLRLLWAAASGRKAEREAWRTVRDLPHQLRGPISLRGTAVRELAEGATALRGPIDLDRTRQSG
jgi:GT2 family glycosyltransferase